MPIRRPTLLRSAAAAAIACCCLPVAAQSALTEWAKGRLIVMPRAGLPQAQLDALLAPHGGKARRLGGSDLHVVELPPQVPETAVLRLLQRQPQLKFAELDHKVRPLYQSNDPYFASQWHLAAMRTGAAWDRGRGDGVTIAILDSGIDLQHPDLAGSLVAGYNFHDRNTQLADVTGHGTPVAGTAAAALNNATGVAGVAGAARIMPLRVSDTGGWAYFSTVAEAVTWAADRGARVVNCSYGNMYKSSSVQSAAAYLRSKGGLMFVSAGNGGIDEGPAAGDSIVVVSATSSNDQLAGFSSFGPAVTLSAPGVGILTTSRGSSYGTWNGTSFSAPAAAAVAALVMSVNPALSASQVQGILTSTAVDLGAAGRDNYYGHGRVDAQAAVTAALDMPAADTQRPSVAIASPAAAAVVNGVVPVDVVAGDNIGVARVELRANGALVASDLSAPYQFSWDSTRFSNGPVTLTAVAVDAAGNSQTSPAVSVSVYNAAAADTTPPVVSIANPSDGAALSGTVKVSVSATDNAAAAGITQTLLIDGVRVATAVGGALNFSWNLRKATMGTHSLTAVATDAAGNTSSRTVTVTRAR